MLGSAEVQKKYIGNIEIIKQYKGTQLIYDSTWHETKNKHAKMI